ncbi:hypothetical protein [Actinotalea sp. JY-7876]|uniref:hypothetical protein n=1 Tax=Actinotalea sp. JY-7876 TaxID=2758442 RepID=UPI0015F6F85D|nr:hypothetical protein [Actinotalea sp. JY-7876]
MTPEGHDLVHRHVAALTHPDTRDQRENQDHGCRPSETGATAADRNNPNQPDGPLGATESDVDGAEDDDDSALEVTAPARDWAAELGPLLPLAAELFDTWTSSCEVQWAGYAMAAVRRAALPDGDDPAMRVVDPPPCPCLHASSTCTQPTKAPPATAWTHSGTPT